MGSTVTSARVAGALLVERGLLSPPQLGEALEHQRAHGGTLEEVISKLFDLPRDDIEAVIAANGAGATVDVGAILLATGVVDEERLAEAREKSRMTGQPVGPILVEMGAVSRLELASALADQWSDSPATILPSPSAREQRGEGRLLRRGQDRGQRVVPDADVDDLRQRQHELVARIAALEIAIDEPVEADPALIADLEALARRLQATEASLAETLPPTALDATAAGLEALRAELATLEERFAVASADVARETGELAGRVDAAVAGLAEELSRVGSAVEELAQRPAGDPALAGQLEEMQTALTELASRPLYDPELATTVAELASTVAALVERPSGDPEAAARADQLVAQLAELETSIEQLAARPAGDPDAAAAVAALSARVDDLASGVAELGERPAVDPGLAARVDELAHAVDGLSVLAEASSGAEGLQDALAGLSARVEAAATATADVEGLRDAFAELRGEVEALRAAPAPETVAPAELEALAAGVQELRDAVAEVAARPTGDPALETTVTEIAGRVADLGTALEETTAGLSATTGLAAQLEALAERVEALSVEALGPAAEAAVAGVAARVDEVATTQAETAERIEALRARLVEAEAAVTSAAATPTIDGQELGARIEEVSASVDARVATLAERIDQLASPGAADALRAEVGELAVAVETLRQTTRDALDGLERRLDTQPVAEGAAAAAGAAAGPPELAGLAREIERLRDRVVEQERSLVEHFARRERALTERMTGGSDVAQRLAELTRLIDEQRSRIDRLTGVPVVAAVPVAAADGSGVGHEEIAVLKEALFSRIEKLASSIDWRFQRLEGSPADTAGAGGEAKPGGPVGLPSSPTYVALVPTASGHQLIELAGEGPEAGSIIPDPLGEGDLLVVAVGTSPLPGDERPCAFVEPANATTAA